MIDDGIIRRAANSIDAYLVQCIAHLNHQRTKVLEVPQIVYRKEICGPRERLNMALRDMFYRDRGCKRKARGGQRFLLL